MAHDGAVGCQCGEMYTVRGDESCSRPHCRRSPRTRAPRARPRLRMRAATLKTPPRLPVRAHCRCRPSKAVVVHQGLRVALRPRVVAVLGGRDVAPARRPHFCSGSPPSRLRPGVLVAPPSLAAAPHSCATTAGPAHRRLAVGGLSLGAGWVRRRRLRRRPLTRGRRGRAGGVRRLACRSTLPVPRRRLGGPVVSSRLRRPLCSLLLGGAPCNAFVEAAPTAALPRIQLVVSFPRHRGTVRQLSPSRPHRLRFGSWPGRSSLVEVHDEAVHLDGASARAGQSVDRPSDLRELRLRDRLAWCGRRAAPRLRRAFRRHSCQI